MNNGISVKITYFTEQNGELGLYDFEGISEFKQELEDNYISVIYSRPGELGGIGELIIDLVANIGLADLPARPSLSINTPSTTLVQCLLTCTHYPCVFKTHKYAQS